MLESIKNLLKVKTLVTLVVITVFAVLSFRGDITADNAMIIISMVVSFYFGTSTKKPLGRKPRRGNKHRKGPAAK